MSATRVKTYYTNSINQETTYPSLQEDLRVDVAIVGGGFTGVCTALELSERGYKVALVEANKIGWGATGRNGGQVTGSLSGDAAMTKQLRSIIGCEAENFVWNLRWRGHDIIKRRVSQYAIQCDLKYGHLQAAYKPGHLPELRSMLAEGQQRDMGEYLRMVDQQDIPEYLETSIYHGGLLNTRNMHLHSLNLCIGEARAAESLGAQIFEDSKVIKINHSTLPSIQTAHGKITADSVVLAGNAYHKLERSKLLGTLFPASLGNMVTEPLGDEVASLINPKDLAVYDCRFVLDYYRMTADKRLMFGGGTNYSGRDSKSVAKELRPAMERTFPRLQGVKIEHEWTGLAGIVLNRIPQLGKLSNNVYYCQGYSGHGIASTHIMGEILAKTISGDLEEFKLFEAMKHVRLPLPEWLGNQALAMGMQYYKLMEHFR